MVTAEVQELWFMGLQSVQASVAAACGLRSCGSPALELGLRSCGARVLLPLGMWNLPEPGNEPISSALARRIPIHCVTRKVPIDSFDLENILGGGDLILSFVRMGKPRDG